MKATKIILAIVILASIAGVSCKKTGPADAVIIVIDSAGQRVSGALVVLRQDSVINPTNNVQASVNQMGVTDIGGQCAFTFKLEAVLNVEASKAGRTGRDFIRLERDKTVNKTVIIR